MTIPAFLLGAVIAFLAAVVVSQAIRAFADVRIAAHTGVDPRADRAVAKAAQVRQTQQTSPGSVDRIAGRGHPSGGPTN